MSKRTYLMESDREAARLEHKTDFERLAQQARWAGIAPGMRVADIGCGSGKTTSLLYQLVQPGGMVVGVDASEPRLAHARQHFAAPGIEYAGRDFYQPLGGIGTFDFIWVRFVLEYHKKAAVEIARHLLAILNPGGILCLIDLDHNCLSHYGCSERLERAIGGVIGHLEKTADFDPYLGRKLYSMMYDLGLKEIRVEMAAHHLIVGELSAVDAENWLAKLEVAAKNSGYSFNEYAGGFAEFRQEFTAFFHDPRRFTYTPLIACRGRKLL
jgi:SAM-dependent methyltransferase